MRPLLTVALALAAAAPGAARAQTSTLQPFTLTGTAYIQARGEALRRPIDPVYKLASLAVVDQNVPAYNMGASLPSTADAANRQYTFAGQVPRDESGTLLQYRFSGSVAASGYLWALYYQGGGGNSKSFAEVRSAFSAPAAGDHVENIALDDMCSLTLSLAGQVAGEDITSVQATANSGPVYSFTDPLTSSAGVVAGTQVAIGDPKEINGFLSTTSGGKETATVEFLVRNNRTYSVEGFVTFAGFASLVRTGAVSVALTDANCTNATLVLPVKMPQEKISGSLWLRADSAYAGGPAVTGYNVQFPGTHRTTGAYVGTEQASLVPAGDAPVAYSVRAAPANFRAGGGSPNSSSLQTAVRWPDSRTGVVYLPTTTDFWTPVATSTTKRGAYPDGSVMVAVDEQEQADFSAPMAFLDGTLVLQGCGGLTDLYTGEARMRGHAGTTWTFVDEFGVSRTGQSGAAGGYSTAQILKSTGVFELVGTPGLWNEDRYLLAFTRPGTGSPPVGHLSSTLDYMPVVSAPHPALAAGKAGAGQVARTIRLGAVTVTMQVRNADGTLRPFRNPALAIAYSPEPGSGTPPATVANFTSTAAGTADLLGTHRVTILAPPGARNITASAMVPANPDGTGAFNNTSFPALPNVPFRAPRPDGRCAAVCAKYAAGAWTYFDDDETNPAVTLNATPARTRADSVLLAGTVVDESPVDVTIAGTTTAASGAPPAQTFGIPVALALGANTITATFADRCGGSATRTVSVARDPNNPPVLVVPGTQTVWERTAVSFSNSATDADGDALSWSLGTSPALAGATIHPATGAVSVPAAGVVPGTYTLTVTVSDGYASVSRTVTLAVNARVPARLVFTTQPANTTAGATMAAVVVQVQDSGGVLCPTATNAVTLAFGANPGSATLGGTRTVAAVGGAATFATLAVDKAGTGYTLAAAAAGLAGATSAVFDVTAGAAAKLAFTVQPSDTASGAAISPAVAVSVQDSLGNTVATSTASVALAFGTNPSAGTLAGVATRAAVAGVATFADLAVDKAGTGYTLTASASGLAGATSTAFDVRVGAAAKLVFVEQPSDAVSNAAIAPAVRVAVQDAAGNTISDSTASVALAFGANPSSGTLGGATTAAAVSGVATFPALSVDKAGTGYTLAASASGLAGATSAAFDIAAGPAAKLAFTLQPSDVAAGAAIAPGVEVAVQDAAGNTVGTSSAAIALAFGVNPALATLGGTMSRTAVAGTAAFANLVVDKAGRGFTLVASSAGLAAAASEPFDVFAGAPARLRFVDHPSDTRVHVAIAPPVTVEILDASGNRAPSAAAVALDLRSVTVPDAMLGGTVSVAAVEGLATFAGLLVHRGGLAYTLGAASAGLAGDESAAFDVVDAAPAVVAGQEVTVNEGEALVLAVEATDADGDAIALAATSLPDGAAFDALTGTLTWTPGFEAAGDHTASFTATANGVQVAGDVLIHVVDVNRPPVLAAIAEQRVAEAQALSFATPATDPDGDVLAFAIPAVGAGSLPEGATYDAASRTFAWTPTRAQAGEYRVLVRVSDGRGGEDSQEVLVTVDNSNRPPAIAAVADIETEGPGGFAFTATDPDGDPLVCTAEPLPPGALFDAEQRRVDWAMGIPTAGSYTIELRCTDGEAEATLPVRVVARVFERLGGGLASRGCDGTGGAGSLGSLLAVLLAGLRRRRR